MQGIWTRTPLWFWGKTVEKGDPSCGFLAQLARGQVGRIFLRSECCKNGRISNNGRKYAKKTARFPLLEVKEVGACDGQYLGTG